MYYTKFLYPIIIIAILLFIDRSAVAQSAKIIKWIVEKNSTLRVQGKSNINNFTCNINEYAKKDTLVCANDPSGKINFSGEIQMEILSFNCHSNMITKDLRKTLQADEYPKMTIRFISLQNMPSFQNKPEFIKGWVEVELAGVTKKFELIYSFVQTGLTSMQMNGDRSFHFSDFKLSPPKKLGGLIKIKDDFDVNFQLILQVI